MSSQRALIFATFFQMSKFVAARFCEGGHICSLPRECCTQGCCPPYQSGPRQLPPPSEHVLNLFFISHWFFWCVVVAIILAILCAYSLWRKRRTLCGWGFPEHHAHSEGDSAGSCYAPPQYSRCSSFHHPPPPYTEVTSKPDLYPLVFTCNSENGKNGSSYLMVQYFRNYIVRPTGSLSAASTVDSLSSSFICNINEANTLVPPPYSRAASPDAQSVFGAHYQQQYVLPRSASQVVCHNLGGSCAANSVEVVGAASGRGQQEVYAARGSHYAAVTLNGTVVGSSTTERTTAYVTNAQPSESGSFYDNVSDRNDLTNCSRDAVRALPSSAGFAQSQSDQHFRYIATSNSSISDIFLNNSCAAGLGAGAGRSEDGSLVGSASVAGALVHPHAGGTPVIYSNGCIKPIPLHRASTNPTQFAVESPSREAGAVYNSSTSIGGISISVPGAAETTDSADPFATDSGDEFRDLHLLRRNLETCSQLLQQQQQQQQQQHHQQQQPKTSSAGFAAGDSPLRINDLVKKYTDDGLMRSYATSGTCSGVSSLANIGTPSSPPQATSPTGEVKEILDQIRQLQVGVAAYDEDMTLPSPRPTLQHTMSSPCGSVEANGKLQRIATMPEHGSLAAAATAASAASAAPSVPGSVSVAPPTAATAVGMQRNILSSSKSSSSGIFGTSKRPSTLQQNKKRFYSSKPNKAMYVPMMATPLPLANRCILKSPVSSVVSSSFFVNRGPRVRKGWISRSAPTTPATNLPPNCLGDDSPLLHEHDEDQEGEQKAEME